MTSKYFTVFLIISLIYNIECEEEIPNFCDQNYVDSVEFDGYVYRITRDKWVADYNQEYNNVTEFKQNENFSEG